MPQSHARPRRDITVIGASAGGLDVLRSIVASLPSDYAAAAFVVTHMSPESPGNLPAILQRASKLPVAAAEDGAPIVAGEIRVAVPDRHLLLEADRMHLSNGPRENRHRPAIDALFRSAAVAYGPRVTGVVLTGMLDDGSAGLWAIKARGGVAIVQDPADAMFPDMPQNALETVTADHVLASRDIPAALARIAAQPVAPAAQPPDRNMELEVDMLAKNNSTMEKLNGLGEPSKLTCPECGGALWQLHDPPMRFRCHVGHAYTLRNLFAGQKHNVEAALWAALRALEEGANIARHLADQAHRRGRPKSAHAFREKADEDDRHADQLRQLLRMAVPETNATQ